MERQHIMVGAHGRAKSLTSWAGDREKKRKGQGLIVLFKGTLPML
jgi:hypothetical protein